MRKKLWAVGLTSALVLVGAGSVAATAVTQSNGQVHACAQKQTGGLRVAGSCLGSENPITWSVRGPAGPPGPPGPSHLAVTMRQGVRTITVEPVSDGRQPAAASVQCANGETVLSGGLSGSAGGSDLTRLELFRTGPFFDGTHSGWDMQWINRTDAPITVTVTVASTCTAGTMTLG